MKIEVTKDSLRNMFNDAVDQMPYIIVLLIGLVAGYFIFHPRPNTKSVKVSSELAIADSAVNALRQASINLSNNMHSRQDTLNLNNMQLSTVYWIGKQELLRSIKQEELTVENK